MMNDFAGAMGAMGRYGDTMVAHVTPGELVVPRGRMTPKLMAAWKEAMAGADPQRYVVGAQTNSVNPMTGAPEFFDAGTATGGFGGDSPTGDPTDPSGNFGGLGGGDGGGGFFSDIADVGSRALSGQLTGPEAQTGIMGALGWGAPGIGAAMGLVGLAQQAFGISPDEGSFGNEGFSEGSQASQTEPRSFGAAMSAPAPAAPTPPAAFATPTGLGLEGLDPLQQRSRIATLGTGGDDSRFRDDPAQNFYRNLIQRQFTGAMNLDGLLPVERAYMSQVMGLTNFDSPGGLVSGLSQLQL